MRIFSLVLICFVTLSFASSIQCLSLGVLFNVIAVCFVTERIHACFAGAMQVSV